MDKKLREQDLNLKKRYGLTFDKMWHEWGEIFSTGIGLHGKEYSIH